MITAKKELKEYLQAELKFYETPRAAILFRASENAILRRHQILLRKTEYYTNTGRRLLRVLYRYSLRRLQLKYALSIPINTFGKGLHIMHLGPILVNGDVRAGENCSLHINSSIVASRDRGAPTLGNGVVVGVGAVVLGGVTVADNVVIGANAVVTSDVTEPNIAVAGVPARKISDKGRQAN